MSSDFNKANPDSTVGGHQISDAPLSDVLLSAEDAERNFMNFVEETYAPHLHWLFDLLNRESRAGNEQVTFHLNMRPLRHQPNNPLPVMDLFMGWANDPNWKKIASYLGKLGYTVRNHGTQATVTIEWSNPRRSGE